MSADDLTSITDPGLFRKTARKLGLTVRFKPGHGKHFKERRKADIVEDYRRQLVESQCQSGSACGFQTQVDKQFAETASTPQPCSPDVPLDAALDVPAPLPSARPSSIGGVDHAAGEVQVSVMSADDLTSIRHQGLFRKTAWKLGLTVRVKSDDGKGYKRRHKADLVEDYRQQLAKLQRSSVSACGFQTQVDVGGTRRPT